MLRACPPDGLCLIRSSSFIDIPCSNRVYKLSLNLKEGLSCVINDYI